MLAEWGQWDARIGQPAEVVDLLTAAYIRRQRFLARSQAAEIGALFTGGKGRQAKRMPAATLLREMGMSFDGG